MLGEELGLLAALFVSSEAVFYCVAVVVLVGWRLRAGSNAVCCLRLYAPHLELMCSGTSLTRNEDLVLTIRIQQSCKISRAVVTPYAVAVSARLRQIVVG